MYGRIYDVFRAITIRHAHRYTKSLGECRKLERRKGLDANLCCYGEAGLTRSLAEVITEVVAELKAQHKTIIFSTHLMETAERLCDDIILINKSRRVIGGTLRQIKESYSKNMIALRAVGGENVLEDETLVLKVTEHADEKELVLAENADEQILLKKLLENGAKISKFEKIEPSLNDIFISAVES